MVLPDDVTLVTLTGTYLQEDGSPATGSLTFIPSVLALRDPTHNVMIRLRQQRAELNTAGMLSIVLLATDDPDLIPVGWRYDVVERIDGRPQRTWILQLPYTLAGLDIADVSGSVDPSLPTYPAPVFAVTSVVGQIGDVTGAEILADPAVSAALAGKAEDTDLAGLVPYVGAAADVNLGAFSVRSENVNVNEGTLTDPTITDLGGLQIAITSVDCLIRSDATYGSDGWLYRATVPAANLTVTDGAINHVYVTWNLGLPIYTVTTDRTLMNLSNTLPVARLYVDGGVVYSKLMFGYMGRSAAIRWLLRSVRITDPIGYARESGLTISETATRVVNISSGTIWFVLNHIALPGLIQGAGGTTSYLLYHVAGVWVKTTITQYNNTQYDDGTDLATLAASRYAVNWIYRGIANEELVILLGNDDYSLVEAEASPVPPHPSYIDEFYILCGRIIIRKNEATAYSIESIETTQFGHSQVADHNDLDGLQGGIINEYYHLTAAQHTALGTGSVPYTGATSDVDLGAWSMYSDNGPFTEGIVSDPTITDAVGVAVSVTSTEVMIRSNALWGGDERLYRKTIPANTSLAVTDNALNYIYATWNAGSPIYAATTDRSLLNNSTNVPVARIYMQSGSIEYQLLYGFISKGSSSRNFDRIMRIRGAGGIERESGLTITETATRIINISAGYAWFGLSRILLGAVVQGAVGVESELRYHSGGVWMSATITQYNNSQYDNGTNLVSLTGNRYAVNWVYRNIVTNEIDVILGNGDYTLAQAGSSQRPARPESIDAFYVLCGRIIVQSGASTAAVIENVSSVAFNQAAVSTHNDLAGLQGGTASERYHLTSAQHTALGTAISITPGTPAGGGATGAAGQILYDATRLYICTATNTWKYITLTAL